MKELRIIRFRIEIETEDGPYGFECSFSEKLNILRGGNSSGKSTFCNALIYSLGMEELLGSKGPKTLPYSLLRHLEVDDQKLQIISSRVLIEVRNKRKETITLVRSIKSDTKDPKLIEVIKGPHLSSPSNYELVPTYIHDSGSAQNPENGFFRYLEIFLDLSLPHTATTSGGESKLYIQTLFSAFLIEQKRGWTDYIANTPYFAIRDVKTKIVEYLLAFDVFDNERLKNDLQTKIARTQNEWVREVEKIGFISSRYAISIGGIPASPEVDFNTDLIRVTVFDGDQKVEIHEHLARIVTQLDKLNSSRSKNQGNESKRFDAVSEEINQVLSIIERTQSDIQIAEARLTEFEINQTDIEENLIKNKTASKLKRLGAEFELDTAKGTCPTCHQQIDDSLLLADSLSQPMTIDDNIKYLESQKSIIRRYKKGTENSLENLNTQKNSATIKLSQLRALRKSLRKDITDTNIGTEATIREAISLENLINDQTSALELIEKSSNNLSSINEKWKELRRDLAKAPKSKLSAFDNEKIVTFQKHFKSLAKKFGYRSAQTEDIEINRDTLFPFLSGIELREVNTNIKSDSSASDFVRLIWSYLLSMIETSAKKSGNHINFLLLDEPAQHSMAVPSINSLLDCIQNKQNLQCIVAASFDENDEVFNTSTKGVDYKLISVGTKLLKRL